MRPDLRPRPQAAHQSSVERFRARLHRQTPRTFVTHAIVGLCVAYFAWNIASGTDIMRPSGEALLRWGANYAPLAWEQPWRLLVSVFLHVGLMHLAFNMWVLWQVGHLVERIFGNVGFGLLYLFSGLVASLASVTFHRNVPSAGASGAIFGVFGALLAYLTVQRRAIPSQIWRALRSSTLTFVGFNVLFGLAVPFIDNAAHIGGLLGGMLAGAILALPLEERSRGRRKLRILLLLPLSAAVTGGWFVALHRLHRI